VISCSDVAVHFPGLVCSVVCVLCEVVLVLKSVLLSVSSLVCMRCSFHSQSVILPYLFLVCDATSPMTDMTSLHHQQTGGWTNCNVHNVSGPRCPWCLASSATAWTTWLPAFILMSTAYVVVLLKRKSRIRSQSSSLSHTNVKTNIMDMVLASAAAIATFLIVDIIVGFAFYMATDYPYFFFK
jgi:hypothetical protein